MLQTTITFNTAKEIRRSKIFLYSPFLILSWILLISKSYEMFEHSITYFALTIPLIISMTFGLYYVLIQFVNYKRIGTTFIIGNSTLTQIGNATRKRIKLSEIQKITANTLGYTIISRNGRIDIPKQVPNLREFLFELEHRSNSAA